MEKTKIPFKPSESILSVDIDFQEKNIIPLPHNEHKSRKLFTIKTISFVVVGIITLVYTVAEIVIALQYKSLTVLSDGFHNLSDVVGLVIALTANIMTGRRASDRMSYGLVRSGVIGALINCSSLLSLCLYITLDAIPDFINPVSANGGIPIIVIAGCGIIVHGIGAIIFTITGQSHGHSHGGHSHKEHGHKHEKLDIKEKNVEKPGEGEVKDSHQHKRIWDLNIVAMLVHFAGDCIASVFVLIVGLLFHFFPKSNWVKYIDPSVSLIIVLIILITTVPLVKRLIVILLQSTPQSINTTSLREKIIQLNGIVNVHDLHVWQLVDDLIIASIHLICLKDVDYQDLVRKVKVIFHEYGIHSSAIQAEFIDNISNDYTYKCKEHCVPLCKEDWCCKGQENQRFSKKFIDT